MTVCAKHVRVSARVAHTPAHLLAEHPDLVADQRNQMLVVRDLCRVVSAPPQRSSDARTSSTPPVNSVKANDSASTAAGRQCAHSNLTTNVGVTGIEIQVIRRLIEQQHRRLTIET